MKKIFKLFIFMFIVFVTCVLDVKADYTIDFSNSENKEFASNNLINNNYKTRYRITTGGKIVYCYEPYVAYGYTEGVTEKFIYHNCRVNSSKELGYIFANGYGSGSSEYTTGNKYNDYYITQLAVWYYGDRTIYDYNDHPKDILKNFDVDSNGRLTGSYNGSTNAGIKLAADLINDAKDSIGKTASIALNTADTKLNVDSDGKYYISKVITINGSWVRNDVTVTVSGINGVFLTKDSNGTTGSTSFKVGDTIYVKIPFENVTNDSQIKLSITATSKLSSGNLYVCENKDIPGAQKMINYDGNPKEITNALTLSVTPAQVSVIISKKDITGSKEVKGATLVIKKGNTDIEKWVSDGTERKVNLDIGEYTLEETIAPDGYKLSTEKITFKVNANGTVTIGDSVTDKVIMKNEPFYVMISKLELNGSKQLVGATLKITNESGTLTKDLNGKSLTWVTSGNKEKFHLAAGTYYLTEEEAPDGYIKSDKKVQFTVSSNGTITVDKKTVNEIVLENQPIYVYISKLGIDKDKQLEGVTLKITDKDGKLEKDLDGKNLIWVTTSDKERFHLEAGTYYLTEEKAPAGYIKSNKKIEFTVGKDGVITINKDKAEEVVMENEPLYIYISKKSINGKTELPGATLNITNKDGTLDKDLDGKSLTWTSSTKEERFRLAPGSYILTEIEAPKGYELSDAVIEFTITEDGKILYNKQEAENNMIVFKNTPEPEQVQTGSTILYVLFVGIITAGVVTFIVYKRKND